MNEETKMVDDTGQYIFNSETGVLRIIADDPTIASKTVGEQMMETGLFPAQFTISAIIYSTQKGAFLTSLIVGNEIKKFLKTGITKETLKGKSFLDHLREVESAIEVRVNIIIYDAGKHRFLFHKGTEDNVVFPISRNIGVDTVPSQAVTQRLNKMGLGNINKDKMVTLWTYNKDDLKAYNRLVVVPVGFEPEDASRGSEYVWVDVEDIPKVGTKEDIVALFNVEEKLHKIMEVDHDQTINYDSLVDHIME